MNKKIIRMIVVWTCFLLCFCAVYTVLMERTVKQKHTENSIVILNEIEKLTEDESGNSPAGEQIETLRAVLEQQSVEEQKNYIRQIAVAYTAFLVTYVLGIVTYLYLKIIRPFQKLEDYAEQIAKGNLDVSLKYERTNFFGAFTWAFDHMREEILYARKNEEKAIKENKTIIAALSHDIKTPIASIRAYAEGLEANLSADYEKRERYLQVIMKKCDEVTKLTNDLVLHSLSELESLEIKEQAIDIGSILEQVVSDLENEYIVLKRPVPARKLIADGKRVVQVIENLVNNAQKYAPNTKVEIWAEALEKQYEIHIRDYGEGILPEDMPFVFEKFYRGKNVEGKPGSGLGLYIVKYIMNKMNGEVRLVNRQSGLEVILEFRVDE